MSLYKNRSRCWTNMAQAYVILGEKDEACKLLVNASEVEPLLWEIWRDLAILSADCKNYGKTIQAYTRILELGRNYLNIDLLDKIIYGVSNEIFDRDKLTCLFKKLIEIFPKYPPLWCSYGLALSMTEKADGETRKDVIKALENSLKILIDDKNWYLNSKKVGDIIDSAYHIIRAFIATSDKFYGTPESVKLLQIAKAVTNNLTQKLETSQNDIISGEIISRFYNTYKSLKTLEVTIDKKLFYKDFVKEKIL